MAVISSELVRPMFAIASLILLLGVACGTHPAGAPETETTKALPRQIREAQGPPSVAMPPQREEFAGNKLKREESPSPDPVIDETPKDSAAKKIDWGREATLDEIMAMAKNGEIPQIEWHVMPNVIRAEAADGRIFHIRNENKGIDIRNTLIRAGISIGKGGISFRHVF
jgi:hypothetical protein